jgi:hypothetical protein
MNAIPKCKMTIKKEKMKNKNDDLQGGPGGKHQAKPQNVKY